MQLSKQLNKFNKCDFLFTFIFLEKKPFLGQKIINEIDWQYLWRFVPKEEQTISTFFLP